jgi:hypothetical protein
MTVRSRTAEWFGFLAPCLALASLLLLACWAILGLLDLSARLSDVPPIVWRLIVALAAWALVDTFATTDTDGKFTYDRQNVWYRTYQAFGMGRAFNVFLKVGF